ncbi:MAG: hypothetical protein AB7S36_16620, partial [Planctomycetota bacterium]
MPTTATYDIIRKQTHPGGVSPNLSVRDSAWSSFTWDEARRLLDGLPGGSINIACERSTGMSRMAAASTWRSAGWGGRGPARICPTTSWATAGPG